MDYGYARVSTKEQNEARQMKALREAGVKKIYLDKQSGKDFDRPEWIKMVNRLRPGDTLYMLSLDRMGRNYEDIQEQWRVITVDHQADIIVLDCPILNTKTGEGGLTGKLIANIVLQLLAYVAQMEREKIRERQEQGIKAALERGVRFGRRPKELPDNFDDICRRYMAREIHAVDAAEQAGMGESTFRQKCYEWRRRNDEAEGISKH